MDPSPRTKAIFALLMTLAVAVALAACGGGGSSSSGSTGGGTSAEAPAEETEAPAGEEKETSGGGGSAEEVAAKALAVAEEHKEVTQIGPTEPIKKPIPEEKYVIYVNCGQPACVSQGEAFEEAAKVLGWKSETINVKLPTPEEIQAAFEEVIRKAPDGVASAGFGPALYSKQLKKLNEMGVFVAEQTGEVESGEDGVDYDPLGPEKAAEALAALANKSVSDAGGEGEFGAILLTGFPIVEAYTAGWTEEIEAICPECTVKTLEVTPESIGKSAPEEITNFLRANSGIHSILLSYGALSSGLAAALKNAGVEIPEMYAWGIDPPGIEELQKGELSAAAPDPYQEVSWQSIDGMARSFAGEKTFIQPFQEPVIWAESFGNVPTTTEPRPEVNPDYQEQFKKLWGK
jgi:ABC-type sugar transport system substrate-binding protein